MRPEEAFSFFERAIAGNHAAVEALASESREGRLVPFIGAGVSADSGLPAADELKLLMVEQIARASDCDDIRARVRDRADRVTRKLMRTWLELLFWLARTYGHLWPQVHELLVQVCGLGEPALGHRYVAQLLSAGCARVACTLNFDDLIERACTNVDLRVAFDEPSFGRWLTAPDLDSPPWLLKFHGTMGARDPRGDSVVASLDQTTRGLDKARQESLFRLLRGWSLCFLGCSGRDEDLFPLLKDAPPGPSIFWVVRPPPPDAGEQGRAQYWTDRAHIAELLLCHRQGYVIVSHLSDVWTTLCRALHRTPPDGPPPPASVAASLQRAAAEWGRSLSYDGCAAYLAELLNHFGEPLLADRVMRRLLSSTKRLTPEMVGTAARIAFGLGDYGKSAALCERAARGFRKKRERLRAAWASCERGDALRQKWDPRAAWVLALAWAQFAAIERSSGLSGGSAQRDNARLGRLWSLLRLARWLAPACRLVAKWVPVVGPVLSSALQNVFEGWAQGCRQLGDQKGWQAGVRYAATVAPALDATRAMGEVEDRYLMLGEDIGVANALRRRALVALSERSWPEAAALSRRALCMSKILGDKPGIAKGLMLHAMAVRGQRRWRTAAVAYAAAIRAFGRYDGGMCALWQRARCVVHGAICAARSLPLRPPT